MRSVRPTVFAILILAAAAFGSPAVNFETSDEDPDVTDRVARISSLKGNVTIRREGSDEWEKADLNLPVMEGDEISAAEGSRFEIQFNASTHVRVSENSYLRIATLTDAGIALSLSEGTLSATLSKFDPAKSYFEIDAPKTTIAVQRSGRYRIDAGKPGGSEVRVSVLNDGEARIYSNNSGFTIRDGRSAKIFVEGSLAGEWENGNASNSIDEFDEWVASRESELKDRLSRASYGQFYDDDIYGADELTDNGDWTYTRDYGYLWRPYSRSISVYSDWSPYRYGHWRWLPAYGWTWVNDEPWGWATYHHGRWIWHNGSWYWSPYSYYRYSRSWWSPALVVIRIVNNNVCWYPLSYRHRYNNYNRYLNNHRPVNQTTTSSVPSRPTVKVGVPDNPEIGVIEVPLEDFGKTRRVAKKLDQQTARRTIFAVPANDYELKRLPKMGEIRSKVSREIRADSPPFVPIDTTTRTGAEKRDRKEAMDTRLRNKIILGDRPVITPGINPNYEEKAPDRKVVPKTGAVSRPLPQKETPPSTEPTREAPQDQEKPRRSIPTVEPEKRRETPPIFVERPRNEAPKPREAPSRSEPTRSEPTRSEPPARRSDPPPQKSEPSKKSDPPPQKSEPSRSTKPAETKKDN